MSKFSCVRCGAETPQLSPPVCYCPGCIEWFKQDQKTRGAKTKDTGSGRVYTHATPAHEAPKRKDNPNRHLITGEMRCGLCGCKDSEAEYGFCCYGLGGYRVCGGCGYVLEFQADTGK